MNLVECSLTGWELRRRMRIKGFLVFMTTRFLSLIILLLGELPSRSLLILSNSSTGSSRGSLSCGLKYYFIMRSSSRRSYCRVFCSPTGVVCLWWTLIRRILYRAAFCFRESKLRMVSRRAILSIHVMRQSPTYSSMFLKYSRPSVRSKLLKSPDYCLDAASC